MVQALKRYSRSMRNTGTSEMVEGPEAWTRFRGAMKKALAVSRAQIQCRIKEQRRPAARTKHIVILYKTLTATEPRADTAPAIRALPPQSRKPRRPEPHSAAAVTSPICLPGRFSKYGSTCRPRISGACGFSATACASAMARIRTAPSGKPAGQRRTAGMIGLNQPQQLRDAGRRQAQARRRTARGVSRGPRSKTPDDSPPAEPPAPRSRS